MRWYKRVKAFGRIKLRKLGKKKPYKFKSLAKKVNNI